MSSADSGTTYLDAIIRHHRARALRDERVWQDRIGTAHYEGPSFFDALANAQNPNVKVIAEIKRRSPSKGWLNEHLDPATLTRVYQENGAAAISVLTDEPHFAGSLADLRTAHTGAAVPLLRKDFTVSPNDVLDAAEAGAAAVLLIAAVLDDAELSLLYSVAHQCGLDVLVEVHDATELFRVNGLGARIVGINQRDLHTFSVDTERAAHLASLVPTGSISVAESGFSSSGGVRIAAAAGFDAVLVGEAFVTAEDIPMVVREFAAIPRRPR